MKKKAVMSWSSGKDSSLALYRIQQAGDIQVVSLLTTFNEKTKTIPFHHVPVSQVEAQAKALNLPLKTIFLPEHCSNAQYEKSFLEALTSFVEAGATHVIFGDLFLEEIRDYRLRLLEKSGLDPLFPLWKKNTLPVAHEIIELGFRAIITGIDSAVLSQSFAGRPFDHQFLADIPDGVDPCGENGEFHTFVYDGPNFSRAVEFVLPSYTK